MNDGIQFAELVAYTEEENERWKQFFATNPGTLDLPFDIAGSVRQLLLHIFSVELYFANAVLGLEKVSPNELPTGTLDELFGIGKQAAGRYREFFGKATAEDWAGKVELGRGTVHLKASKRKLVAQALTHSLRHWAQIATFLRQQGFKQEWNHDFLLSKAMELRWVC
jgi:uncharacterized damage-inducible protein DinB